ncbi:UDP-3-O-(3-hydroxymyristoyl)glucosamine N-acyltransferase [Planctomycetota bacterium]
MDTTLGELARLVEGEVFGDASIKITGFAGLEEAQPGQISFLSNKKYLPLIKKTQASAVVLPEGTKSINQVASIHTAQPDLAFARIVEYFSPQPPALPLGIHQTAVIGKNVRLGKDVTIQYYAVIQDDASIGDKTVIYPNVYIGHATTIGQNCCIYPNVVIRERVAIGNNVIIHSGAVIGSDGFGYVLVKGKRVKIPQVGSVVIEDDVEIGANVTIDRARFGKTWIKRGTKLDNLVQIAHNVVIGEDSVIVAQSGIAGSARTGNNFIMAAQSGIDGHIRIGDNVMVGSGSGVFKNLESNQIVSGFPAEDHKKHQREQALIRRLPQIIKKLEQKKK